MSTALTSARYQANAASTAASQPALAALFDRVSSQQWRNETFQTNYQGVSLPNGQNTGSLLYFYNDILSIGVDEDDEAEEVSVYALETATYIVEKAFNYLQKKWKNPRIATDGGGGIRMTWKIGQGEIRAVIPSNPRDIQYIYFEMGDEPRIIPNFTSITLCDKFDILLRKDG